MEKTTAPKKEEKLEVTILPERDLDTEIKNELVKANVTDAVLAALEEKYGNMKLVAIDDKESYLEICEARKEVRKVGIITEKICKRGREDAIAIQKKWLGKENDILAKIAITQDKLDAEKKIYEDEEARKEQEILQQQENNYQERQRVIIKMGAVYNNGCFELNGVSYEMDLLKTADKETWEEVMLPKYQREYEKLEAIRVEEEKRKEAEAAKLREEQAELEKQKAELARQQETMRKQMDELQNQKNESERLIREQQQKEADELRIKQDVQNKARMQRVMALGLNYSGQYKSFIFEDVAVAEVDIISYSQEKWDKMIEEITPTIARNKEEVLKREKEHIQQEKDKAVAEAMEKERLRIESERIENERVQKEKDTREAEELAKASDKDKWNAFIVSIGKLMPISEMSSPTYKGKANSATEILKRILAL